MFRFFENLVDPYVVYEDDDTPPQRLWPFFRTYIRPFKRVFWATGIMSIVVAVIEIWLIAYMGRLVDLIAPGTEGTVWSDYGWEFVAVGIFLLTLRPILQVVDVALLGRGAKPLFSHVNYGGLPARQFENGLGDQPVVNNHIGLVQNFASFQSQ